MLVALTYLSYQPQKKCLKKILAFQKSTSLNLSKYDDTITFESIANVLIYAAQNFGVIYLVKIVLFKLYETIIDKCGKIDQITSSLTDSN